MKVFNTYFYEVLKGTKPVALVTCEGEIANKITEKLKKSGLDYTLQNLPNPDKNRSSKVNIFFGAKECIEVVEKFLSKPLDDLDPFEDFILGAILGYDIKIQCKRLLNRSR